MGSMVVRIGQALLTVVEVVVHGAAQYVAWNTSWQKKDIQIYTKKVEEEKFEDLAIAPGLEDRVQAIIHRCVPCQWFDQPRQCLTFAMIVLSFDGVGCLTQRCSLLFLFG